MKGILSIALALILALTLCGCSREQESYSVTQDGMAFQVNTREGTIRDGAHTYRYEFSGDAKDYDFEVTYPDGSSFWYRQSGASGFWGWSEDYDENAYVPGETLRQVILQQAPREMELGTGFFGLVVLILSALDICNPRLTWYLGYGWRFANAEPSQAAMTVSRIGGVIGLAVGLILLLG